MLRQCSMRWRTLDSFEGLMMEKMDVRRVVVVLFTIFFYCVRARPVKPLEVVSQKSWTGIFPRLKLEISDDNNIMRRYVLPISLMISVAFLAGTWIFRLYRIWRRRGKQKKTVLFDVIVEKPDNEPSNTEESPDTQESVPMCKIPGCFLRDIISPSSIYVTNFQEKKEELAKRLYRLYNTTIFRNQLPEEMEIVWKKKEPTLAGATYFSKKKTQRCCRIELSDNVVTSVERLRHTLAHEMCHAACWIIDATRNGHGVLWQAYAEGVTSVHPELPKVKKCHNYGVRYNFYYHCTSCDNKFGSFRKVAKDKWYCPLCGGRLHQLATTKGCYTNKSNSG